ncbi:MAG: dTDP-4-dehydrorhamnose reductase [Rhodothermales bacterium]
MLYRRVLITGANGLLGQQLVRRMGGQPEYDVLATGLDDEPRFSGGSCGYARLDVTQPERVKEVFLDFAPDVVINCAAMTNVDACEANKEACWQLNADSVETLARRCLQTGARLVQLSTDFIFDGEHGPYRENARPNPLSYYGRSKLAGENAARGAGMDRWAIVRTVLVYGHAEGLTRSNIVLWLLDKFSRGESVNMVTDQWRTPTYAPDLAAGVERLIRFGKHGVYHLSGRDFMSIHELALETAEVFGFDPGLIQPATASTFSQAARRPARSGFIILKAETEVGYNPRPFREALVHLGQELGLKTYA